MPKIDVNNYNEDEDDMPKLVKLKKGGKKESQPKKNNWTPVAAYSYFDGTETRYGRFGVG
jgi:hypothetical protein